MRPNLRRMFSAERYSQLRATAIIRERPLFPLPRNFSELDLQARWFAGDFGRSFTGTAGEEIEIVQFGIWNREAGPDFSDAAIRINRGEVQRGSIEFDLVDQNWETHGHATNPAFDQNGAARFRGVGRTRFLCPDKREPAGAAGAGRPGDPACRLSRPIFRSRAPGRCHAPLRDLPEEKINSILDAAAQFRLQRKTLRLQRLTRVAWQR